MSFSKKMRIVSVVMLLGLGLTSCTDSFDTKNTRASRAGAKLSVDKKNPLSKIIRNQLIRHEFAVGEIEQLCAQAMTRLQNRLNSEVTDAFQFEQVLADANEEFSPLTFMGYVHTNELMRSESSACEEQVGKAFVEIYTRRDLYQKIANTKAQNAEELRLVTELKRGFEQSGMALNDADLETFKSLKSELAGLESQFAKNLNEDTSSVLYTESELKGVPQSFKDRLAKTQDGLYVVTTKGTDFLQLMENAEVPESRAKMLAAYDNRAPANTALLERAVVLRQQIARLMGYKNWADYRTDGRMAQNAENALNLISDLKVKLRPRLEADLQVLLTAKRELEDANAQDLKAWDLRYFAYQIKKRQYSLDDEVIREYFPKDTVMKGMFEIYSTLLNVNYEEVQDASVWSPEVKLYAVREKATNDIVAYFYTDFIPRDGKYGHAAAFTLIQGRRLSTGLYSQPVSAIVSNFTPPSGSQPSLLTHDEVETLFHEFGHIMHQVLTQAPYASLSGSSTSQDFVEAPSQMLENWVWDRDMLGLISGHYTDSSRKLPDTLIEKMLAARNFNQGYFYSRQIMLGLTDLRMHMAEGSVDVTQLYKDTHAEVLVVPTIDNSHFTASFGHLMGGYDAGYYGYIWSEVFAADMFTAFESGGYLNAETGLKYRRSILEQGSMKDPLEIITEFLGRAPNNEAFLRKLGL